MGTKEIFQEACKEMLSVFKDAAKDFGKSFWNAAKETPRQMLIDTPKQIIQAPFKIYHALKKTASQPKL